jgi:hypothetical protein
MKADIIRVAQEADFEQDVTANFVHLRLPSGRVVRALIDDEAAQAIVEDKVRFGAAPKPAMSTTASSPSYDRDPGERPPPDDLPEYIGQDGVPVSVFGGGDIGEPAEFSEQEDPSSAGPPIPLPARPSLRRPQPPRPVQRIQADESGNPIVATPGGVNPDDHIAGGIAAGMTAG